MEYASARRRVAAYLVDILILMPVASFCGGFLATISRPFLVFSPVPVLIVNLLFFVYCVKKYGGSPGKLMLGLRITKTDGSPVGYREVILRHVVSFLLTATSAVAFVMAVYRFPEADYWQFNMADWLFDAYSGSRVYVAANIAQEVWIAGGFFAMLMTPDRRAFHDFMAGTVVLRHHAGQVVDTEHKTWPGRLLAWIDRTSFISLLGRYIAIINAVFFIGIFLFFFPIMPIYIALDMEFSNLGPIVTALWAVLFDVCVVTPAFVIILLVKLVRAAR